jgi:hypothetical protein
MMKPANRVQCPYVGADTVVCPVHAPTATRMVIWEGPSLLDGSPIIVLATGVPTAAQRKRGARSGNVKTGDMVQTYILRADINPVAVLRAGADVSICGVCPHKSRAAGGSWQQLADAASGVTGYTHQWDADKLSAAGYATDAADIKLAEWCMASADTAAEGRQARRLGFRSFIVRGPNDPKPAGAVVCPASAEGGKRTVCAACMSCGGTGNGRRNDVTIIAHGSTAGSFRPSLPLFIA